MSAQRNVETCSAHDLTSEHRHTSEQLSSWLRKRPLHLSHIELVEERYATVACASALHSRRAHLAGSQTAAGSGGIPAGDLAQADVVSLNTPPAWNLGDSL